MVKKSKEDTQKEKRTKLNHNLGQRLLEITIEKDKNNDLNHVFVKAFKQMTECGGEN